MTVQPARQLRPISQVVREAAEEWGFDPLVLQAIVETESSGRPHAYRFEPGFWLKYLRDNVAYAGCEPGRVSASYGLMQVMYPTAVDLGFEGEPEELFAPAVGLEWGCRALARFLRWAQGDIWVAVAAYNGGWGGRSKDAPLRYQARVREKYAALLARRSQGE